ncbi:helix-turn-helix domain-containing protein [Streptomyces sp. NPDC004111]|uniref:helix-turn-helix domain-containing protein n=1 Tax=Streptomyces sp. NPDC004111 TaxID=3364690 RepID=UPI0036801FD9
MSAQDDGDGIDEVAEFAALLRELKEGTDRSYGALARRLGMNTSTLHRYCAGDAVPLDFAPVERFAALCGATSEQRLELHRRWLRAVDARRPPRPARPAKGAESTPDTASGSGAAVEGAAEPEAVPRADGGPVGVPATAVEAAPKADGGPLATPGTAAHDITASDAAPGTVPGTASGTASDAAPGTAPGTASGTAPDAAPDTAPRTAPGPASDTAPGPVPGTAPGTSPGPASGTAPGATGAPASERDPSPRVPESPGAPTPSPSGRPWYRRRRLVVAGASVCAVLATFGGFSALPDGPRASAGGPDRVAVTEGAAAPERRDAPPVPSGTPTSVRPSGTPTPERRPTGSATNPAQQPSTIRPPGTTAAPPRGEQPTGLPLAWSVNSQAWKLGCGHQYVIAKPPSQVPPPPAPQDAAPWAATQRAVHGGETLVELSVQGRTETAVVLEALRVRVVGRTAPAQGNSYGMNLGCGGAVTPRSFAVDLDKDRPIARAVAGNDTGTPIPPVRMPYRVSAKDPEVLLITGATATCDCLWYLELDWSSQGRKGTVRIDDDGRPFRTSAVNGLPRYSYDLLERRWGTSD